jgi:3-phenylpropionate/trans-cinnamate dioxygenase ferredoxin reductase subunit
MVRGAVIVGGGEAAVAAAFALRSAGYGGPVTLIAREAAVPYERPPLSKQVLDGADMRPIRPEADYGAADITLLRRRTAARLWPDRREVELSDGGGLAYDRLLLATGAEPRRLTVPGAERGPVHYLRDAADALALRAVIRPGIRLAIVGGGLIGLEIAAAAAGKGAAVTVIEASPRVLGRAVPEALAAQLAAAHRDVGVRILTGCALAEIGWQDRVAELRCADGSAVAADEVVAAIGVAPRTRLAATAGLALDNGIATDAELVTSVEGVYAAGDCCSFPHPLFGDRRLRLENWQSAQELGRLAALNMAGAGQAVEHVPWMWSDQYDLGLQIAGLPDLGATTVTRRDGTATLLFHLDAAGRLVGASGLGRGTEVARDIRIAQRLIGLRATPDRTCLADPAASLKALLSPVPAPAG